MFESLNPLRWRQMPKGGRKRHDGGTRRKPAALRFEPLESREMLSGNSPTMTGYNIGTWTKAFTSGTFVGNQFAAGNYLAFYQSGKLTEVDLAAKTSTSFNVGSWTNTYSTGNYLAFYQSGKLTEVDLAAKTITTFNVGTWTNAYTAGNYLAFYQAGKLIEVDLAAKTAHSLNVGTWINEFTAGNFLVFSNAGNLTEVDLAAKRVTSLDVGTWSEEWTAGNYLAFYGSGKLTEVDLAAKRTAALNIGTWTPTLGTELAAGNYLAFYQRGNLTEVDLAARAVTSFSIGSWTNAYTAGNYLAFYQAGKLTDLDLAAKKTTSLTIGNFGNAPSVYAVGNFLAFCPGNGNLVEVDLAAKTVTSLAIGTWSSAVGMEFAAGILYTSGSSIPRRRSTAQTARHLPVTPDRAEARTFQDRLSHAYAEGGFLVLTVRPSRMRFAEAELLRRFDLQRVSFDDLLLNGLREEAKELEVDWSIIEQADGADSSGQDWKNLLHLVGLVGPKITENLVQRRKHLLMVHPGLIARYDLMHILETLRDKVGHDAPCPGLWVLVATDEQNDMPVLDHAEIPLITSGQRAKVSEHWINNEDRGHADGVAASTAAGTKGSN